MSPEELDEARVKEAERRWNNNDPTIPDIATGAARLAREGWTPPDPVDPDVLAWRKWRATQSFLVEWDPQMSIAFLAGARMAREQERERAKVLMECVERYAGPHAAMTIAKYRGEA